MSRATYPEASGGQPVYISSEKHLLPYLVFLQVGFTVPQDVATLRGSLLHYLFTLACFPNNLENIGGLFSVALSVASRHLGVTQHSTLWSSDFPLAFLGEKQAIA